jgi:cysteine-S-conjugate beta-lyase
MDEETRLIHAGTTPKPLVQTVGPPIQKGSTVLLPGAEALYDDDNVITYGRKGLATHAALSEALAEMEHAAAVSLYPSGIAALAGAMLALLKSGDEVLVADTAYKPTRRFCDQVLRRFGIGVGYFDPTQDPQALVGEASSRVRLILMESPGSLTFEMQDTPRVAELARARGILTACDNTWGAGYLHRPLDHGVDLSIQSLTKYVGGHSDVFMGSVAARDPDLVKALDNGVTNLGWSVSAEDAYLMLRGLRTLPTRLARHGQSGLAAGAWLRDQPQVTAVYHPALPGAPGHDLWKRDFSGACGLFTFALKPGPQSAVDSFLNALELFGLGFSWGGFESLALHCDPQLVVRTRRATYAGPLIRLHIGLESPNDLIADLAKALAVYARAIG